MQTEILSIGDELLIGQVINTNASFISEKVNSIGISVSRVTTIGDSEKEILEAMQAAWQKNTIVIATGGLGPTHDDISKHVVAAFFRKKLVLDKKTLAHVRSRFRSFGIKKMPEVNIGQAMIPQGFEVLRNEKGTAPGLLYYHHGKTFIILPGVPHEMTWLMEKWVVPQLKKRYKNELSDVILHRTLLTTGIGESVLSERIGDVTNFLEEGATLAYLPKTSGVRLRISVLETSERKAKAKISRIENYIRNRAGQYIFGADRDTLEQKVVELLHRLHATVATAESCTGGMLSMRITNVPGVSEIFSGGVISYQNLVKIRELGVSQDLIDTFGAVSEACAKAMAEGALKKFGTHLAVSITGIAGPGGGTKEKPVGTVWVALAEKGKDTYSKHFQFAGDRNIVRERSADAALEMLRRRLLRI